MVAFGSSSMVGYNKIGAKAVLLVIWIHFLIIGAAAIPLEELDDMIPVLRRRGYNRFGNAIKTSDLIEDCLAMENLTLFAPTEESMEMAHISGLRSHTVPPRLAVTDLVKDCFALDNLTLFAPTGESKEMARIAGTLIPLARFPSCCLPQSPVRATLQTPSQYAYAGPDASLLRPQSSAPQTSSNGDLLPPHPPETLAADISIGFSISSTAVAVIAAVIAVGVIVHLFRPRQNLAPLDDMDDPQQDLATSLNDIDGLVIIIQMILNTLRLQGIHIVKINNGEIIPVTVQLGLRLRRYYTSRLEILSQPQYKMHRAPDDVIMIIEMPTGDCLHLGQVPHYFMNGPLYANSYVLHITPAGIPW